ncbi:hypothetical protein KPH14_002790 [Odynerus spinipes]|uniref:von Hippel-Lindau disease tumour suppressor beta domain-containing protein n=1 Tax=Odynerus spinipes TaxID=1348599 RepID=A0AAD9RLV8_9HYME|nr:hypothetical protein KPH14_002790 [Odynerus spinipes]
MGGNEEQPLLRSINNDQRSFVSFINTTVHNVVLYWIDYQGQAVSYGVLPPRRYIDIDTFVTHPWIFVDEETTERYMVNHRDVFFPDYKKIARTKVFITLPLYTLRELSLRAIRRQLRYDEEAFKLDIPRSLQHELAKMLPRRDDQENS